MGYSHLGKIVAIIAKMGLIKEIRRKREVFLFTLSLSKGKFMVRQAHPERENIICHSQLDWESSSHFTYSIQAK